MSRLKSDSWQLGSLADLGQSLLRNGGEQALGWTASLSVDHCADPVACLRYQRYFLQGLDANPGVRITLASQATKIMNRFMERGVPGASRAFKTFAKVAGSRKTSVSGNHVGRYLFRHGTDRPAIKVAIDAEDDGVVCDPDSLDWADLYLKTNKWADIDYDPKVHPCVNGNSLLGPDAFRALRKLRNITPSTDLVYWSKLWARRKEATPETNWSIVEHQLRVFESLSLLPCPHDLLAIMPADLPFVNLDDCRRRLDRVGVPWQVGWGDIDTATFWRGLAGANVVFVRSGNHHCVSWRMTDLLCMGACMIFEGAPYTEWYAPLVSGRNYIDAGCRMSPAYVLPPRECYDRIPARVLRLLGHTAEIRRMKRANAAYFDRYAEPEAVGGYLLEQVQRYASSHGESRP